MGKEEKEEMGSFAGQTETKDKRLWAGRQPVEPKDSAGIPASSTQQTHEGCNLLLCPRPATCEIPSSSQVSCSSGWPSTCCGVEDDLLLPSTAKGWNNTYVPRVGIHMYLHVGGYAFYVPKT